MHFLTPLLSIDYERVANPDPFPEYGSAFRYKSNAASKSQKGMKKTKNVLFHFFKQLIILEKLYKDQRHIFASFGILLRRIRIRIRTVFLNV
jgi:hypothetical protein